MSSKFAAMMLMPASASMYYACRMGHFGTKRKEIRANDFVSKYEKGLLYDRLRYSA